MRNVLTLLAAGLLFTAGAAHAVPANFTNTLTLEVSGFDAVSFSGSGTADTEPNGPVSLSAESIVAGFVSSLDEPLLGVLPGFAVCEPGLPVVGGPSPATFPIPATPGTQVEDCSPLGNGALDAIEYDGEGEAIGGLIASAYLTNALNNALVAIPLTSIGVGGTVNFTVLGTQATLDTNPWTTGFVTVTGGLSGESTTFEDEGFDDRDAQGMGQLKLVTTALASLGALGSVPAIAALEITLTPLPEPGTTSIALAAFGTLAFLARRARRS